MSIIYKHTNIINNQSYIGRTIFTMEARLQGHINSAENGSDFEFHKAIREFGIDKFTSEVVNECSDDEVIDMEEFYIDKFNSYENGYNMNKGGSGYGLLSETSKNKFRDNIYTIQENGKTIAENRYTKRNITLLSKDENFLKNIGEKSSKTQKENGKNKGKNNPKFVDRKILIISKDGLIIKELYRFEIKDLSDNYPKRMIIESLKKHKPMYTGNKPRNISFNEFIGSIVCYENEVYSDINTKFKRI